MLCIFEDRSLMTEVRSGRDVKPTQNTTYVFLNKICIKNSSGVDEMYVDNKYLADTYFCSSFRTLTNEKDIILPNGIFNLMKVYFFKIDNTNKTIRKNIVGWDSRVHDVQLKRQDFSFLNKNGIGRYLITEKEEYIKLYLPKVGHARYPTGFFLGKICDFFGLKSIFCSEINTKIYNLNTHDHKLTIERKIKEDFTNCHKLVKKHNANKRVAKTEQHRQNLHNKCEKNISKYESIYDSIVEFMQTTDFEMENKDDVIFEHNEILIKLLKKMIQFHSIADAIKKNEIKIFLDKFNRNYIMKLVNDYWYYYYTHKKDQSLNKLSITRVEAFKFFEQFHYMCESCGRKDYSIKCDDIEYHDDIFIQCDCKLKKTLAYKNWYYDEYDKEYEDSEEDYNISDEEDKKVRKGRELELLIIGMDMSDLMDEDPFNEL